MDEEVNVLSDVDLNEVMDITYDEQVESENSYETDFGYDEYE
ncbi:hypothetical protein NW739_05005 [Mycoplasmopsis felis]|nr:hypothetical protein [Mycoplasmopsis felis]MCU9938374.1 hypothetical protein [Mycoplasmopsis felis]MCU9940041.1 hypothetical protein [Mycoplasmopsis felis]UWV80229.1 hypothetical protein NW072_06460 [Mycoplasmopsis felis]WAM01748.1 hypothetical protein NWE60_05330 [Mycoplasmopsis felis]